MSFEDHNTAETQIYEWQYLGDLSSQKVLHKIRKKTLLGEHQTDIHFGAQIFVKEWAPLPSPVILQLRFGGLKKMKEENLNKEGWRLTHGKVKVIP